CQVASICAPSTSTLTAPALVVLALHVRVGEVLASKEHAESDAERSFETYRLSDASRVGPGASGMVQLPHTSLGRVVVKLMLEFDSACATLTTSEVMAAFAVSAEPDEAVKFVSWRFAVLRFAAMDARAWVPSCG